MRKFFLVSFVLCATLAVAAAGFALEKTPILDNSVDSDGWTSGSSCQIIYYNRCTLWGWNWTGWGPNDVMGTCNDACCPNGVVSTTRIVNFASSPAGYGFTGTVSLTGVDANCCPTNVIASQPWLPTAVAPNGDIHVWNVAVPARFGFVRTMGPGLSNPVGIATDHPAAGPTGPAACGFCYPVTRVNHSFYWGNTTTALCPGSSFNDGVCDAQLREEVNMSCPVSVESDTWGAVKNLYR